MINGVEILSQDTIVLTKFPITGWICFGILLLISFLLIALFENPIGLFSMLISVFIYITGALNTPTGEEYIEYKVTVSEEVNLNEFMDKYEIVSQDGKIYTIKERNQDNE